ncbi:MULTISPECIES: hypothetical protein [Paenibacillus]|uniref:Uncharacterized protein n=1 Tax=Paenibacillus naphthalenovorans TaxID=162209 RepID=A0A0U2W024_9BACL|nr:MULTISPECIES: hypothetical protein [Paenibacillus]ALS20701.1 hypothetical protein IJ22_03120 [Paenibacillus naphthalenovorans]GCL70732.1 hypothetical protein PN4B1_06340 [Paenibacillus naphthalenovorans]SDI24876.1 hypothetical protein SAMN05421868_104208 [Paenibacillus naphthalenovorans]
MAKNKNRKKNDSEFSEEVVENNVKRPAQNNPSEGAAQSAKR